ncbi:MAG TPA: hypothetical protein VN213_06915, partial [Solirubrobacteraceae bacterium]|nr:hypothetical protein [Solirubrobacteraceae bacterium]
MSTHTLSSRSLVPARLLALLGAGACAAATAAALGAAAFSGSSAPGSTAISSRRFFARPSGVAF